MLNVRGGAYKLRGWKLWNLARKHFRIETLDGRHVKLNKFENRINLKELKYYCYKYKPAHVYFSVLNCLFPHKVKLNTK